MASLTEVAYQTRKIIKYGSFVVVTLIAGKILLDISLKIWRRLNPPPPPPPTVSFGKLPPLKFPDKEKVGGLSYKMEVPTGALPEFPDKMSVYFMPYQRPNLLALERATQQAALLGFKDQPQRKSEKIYQWTRTKDRLISLEMDVFSGSFNYTYDWQNDQSLLTAKKIPGKEEAKQEAINFLQKANVLEKDILEGRIEVYYLKVVGNQLKQAVSPSEANFVQVEMFRKKVEEHPVLTPEPSQGIISILISGASSYESRIVETNFNYFPLKYDSPATYPLKTSAAAWQELKTGQAFIARWDGSGTDVVIRRIYLAFYDSYQPQEFLQPIVVFEGDDNFFAYLPAVTADWIQ